MEKELLGVKHYPHLSYSVKGHGYWPPSHKRLKVFILKLGHHHQVQISSLYGLAGIIAPCACGGNNGISCELWIYTTPLPSSFFDIERYRNASPIFPAEAWLTGSMRMGLGLGCPSHFGWVDIWHAGLCCWYPGTWVSPGSWVKDVLVPLVAHLYPTTVWWDESKNAPPPMPFIMEMEIIGRPA